MLGKHRIKRFLLPHPKANRKMGVRIMIKKWIVFGLIVGFVILLIPATQQSDNYSLSPEQEIQQKNTIVQNDIRTTRELNRRQYMLALINTITLIQGQNNEQMEQTIQKQFSLYPNFKHITRLDANNASEYRYGEIDASIKYSMQPYIDQAIEVIDQQSTYLSDPIEIDGDSYYVISTAVDRNGIRPNQRMIAIVNPSIIHNVAIEERKNLRIVPYPSDQRLNIHSVDSDTLHDVTVNEAEDNEGTSHYKEHQVVVKFKKEPGQKQLEQIKTDMDVEHTKQMGNTYVFHSKNVDTKLLMQYFQQYNIEYAEPHFLYLPNNIPVGSEYMPNDELYRDYQWNLPLIHTIEGWDITRGSDDIVVAVVDTGVDLSHPDLSGRLTDGINVIEEGPPNDDVGHGTHVAGVIGALVDNQEGIAGMSWYSKIMPVKVLDHTGAGSTYSVAQGIIWAVDHGASVINLSLGNYAEAEFLHDAIKYAYERNVVLVAATGNDNTAKPGYPAAYPEVIAVSATNSNGNKASFSNYGDYVDVVAPGENIASTYMHSQYAALSGTSMASPHVAALAAMVRAAHPMLNNHEIKEIIIQTTEDLGTQGKDDYFGYGQINVNHALYSSQQFRESILMQQYWSDREL